MSRKEARTILFQMVFELCFHKPEDSDTFEKFVTESKLVGENKEFVESMYTGIVEHFEELIQEIAKHIKGYTIDRLFKVDLAILIMATYELLFYKDRKSVV